MNSDLVTPDDDRNLALAEAVGDINEYITSRLALYADATGRTPQFYVTAVDDGAVEMAASIADFDMMADVFGEQVSHWLEMGLCSEIGGDDDDQLFTATFDPSKVRPS